VERRRMPNLLPHRMRLRRIREPNRSVTKLHRYNNGFFQACAARLTVLRLGPSPARGGNVYSSQSNKDCR
jgi:hypothetical protein